MTLSMSSWTFILSDLEVNMSKHSVNYLNMFILVHLDVSLFLLLGLIQCISKIFPYSLK